MKIYDRQITSIEPMVKLPVTDSEAIAVGEALKLVSGKLTKASGANTPSYVAVGEVAAGTGNEVAAIEIQPDMHFATSMSADGTSLNIGDKVTIATDGINVTATTASGVAEIVGFPNGALTSVGGDVIVKL